MKRSAAFAALTAFAVSTGCIAQDSIDTDSDKYKVLLDNACVRILEYRDEPGQKTNQHYHPPFALYALGPFERVIHLPDGKTIRRTFKAGDVLWSPAQTHIGENVGTTPTRAVLVEAKASAKDRPECSGK